VVSNEPISEQFRIVAKEWVDADSSASLLEEMKSATLSQWMIELGDMPVSKAEMQVKGSERWKTYIESMAEARKRANELKLKLEWLRMRFQEWNSEAATRRQEMRL
jgi:CTP:molybdopterin cytidylyltransferase MocA